MFLNQTQKHLFTPCLCNAKKNRAQLSFFNIKFILSDPRPPIMNTLSKLDITEGKNLLVTCKATYLKKNTA